MLRATSAVLAVSVLAACGGGGGPATFADYQAQSLALAAAIETADVVAPADVPTTGSATYSGPVLFTVEEGALDQTIFAGDLSLDVDFRTNDVGGAATGFVDDQDRTYAGSLLVGSGLISRTGSFAGTALGELDGTLTNGTVGAVEVDSVFAAGFAGDNAEYMAGILAGDIVYNGSEADLEGAVVLEEQ